MSEQEQLRTADPRAPKISRKALLSCQIHEWYPAFRKVTLKTKFVELDQRFVDYLLSDGIVLPKGCEMVSQSGSWSGSDGEWEEDAEDCEPSNQSTALEFDGIVESIKKCIEDLGGSVFPKLNWSSPRDSTWMNAGDNLKCVSIKSSDFIVHDLCHAFDCCTANDDASPVAEASPIQPKPILALRKWFDMQICYEFRCFVCEGVLIVDTLKDFYETEIHGKFPEKSFVFDAYIRHRDWKALIMRPEQAFLVDFNPFGGLTQPLLFAWEEMSSEAARQGGPELRLVSAATRMLPSEKMYGRLPKELHDMSDPRKMDDMLRAFQDQDRRAD